MAVDGEIYIGKYETSSARAYPDGGELEFVRIRPADRKRLVVADRIARRAGKLAPARVVLHIGRAGVLLHPWPRRRAPRQVATEEEDLVQRRANRAEKRAQRIPLRRVEVPALVNDNGIVLP